MPGLPKSCSGVAVAPGASTNGTSGKMSSCMPPRHPRTSITRCFATQTSESRPSRTSPNAGSLGLRRVRTTTSPTWLSSQQGRPAAPMAASSAASAGSAPPATSPLAAAGSTSPASFVQRTGLAHSASPALASTFTVRSIPSTPLTCRFLANASTIDQSSRSGSAGSTVVHSVRSTSGRTSARDFPFTPTICSPTRTAAEGAAQIT